MTSRHYYEGVVLLQHHDITFLLRMVCLLHHVTLLQRRVGLLVHNVFTTNSFFASTCLLQLRYISTIIIIFVTCFDYYCYLAMEQSSESLSALRRV